MASIVTVALVLLAVLFSLERGALLIPGYALLTPTERRKIDSGALCRFVGKMTFLAAGCTALGAVAALHALKWVQALSMGLFLFTVAYTLVYANTGNHFSVPEDRLKLDTPTPTKSK